MEAFAKVALIHDLVVPFEINDDIELVKLGNDVIRPALLHVDPFIRYSISFDYATVATNKNEFRAVLTIENEEGEEIEIELDATDWMLDQNYVNLKIDEKVVQIPVAPHILRISPKRTVDEFAKMLIAIKTSVGKVLTIDDYHEYVDSRRYQLADKILSWLPHAIENFPSVLEHVQYSFFIEKCPRSCSHQLVRHRLASYTQSSTRYFAQNLEFVSPVQIPPLIRHYYLYCLEETKSYEKCRHLLPISLATSLMMSVNLRELMHIISLRASLKASPEIRLLAFEFINEFVYDLTLLTNESSLSNEEKIEALKKILKTKPFEEARKARMRKIAPI